MFISKKRLERLEVNLGEALKRIYRLEQENDTLLKVGKVLRASKYPPGYWKEKYAAAKQRKYEKLKSEVLTKQRDLELHTFEPLDTEVGNGYVQNVEEGG